MKRSNIDKLLSVSSNSIVTGSPILEISNSSVSSSLVSELTALLQSRNGFFAFASALHVFPAESSEHGFGMIDWNIGTAWKQEYGGVADKLLCFGQDIFANQFALCGDGVVVFNCEIGSYAHFSVSLEEWAEKVLSNYNLVTGYSLAKAWQQQNRLLKPGERLFPVQPFVVGGAYSSENLRAMKYLEILKFFGYFSSQIRLLPEGAHVELTTGRKPD